jgi:hypothetical protein
LAWGWYVAGGTFLAVALVGVWLIWRTRKLD